MFKVVESPISLDELARVVGGPDAGAIATFAGTTRETNRGRRVVELEYEAYESMAVSEFEKIAAEIHARWEVSKIAIVHRVGVVAIGDIRLPSEIHVVRLPRDADGYARGLYAALHQLDHARCERILLELPPDEPEWHAVHDRLRRAAH